MSTPQLIVLHLVQLTGWPSKMGAIIKMINRGGKREGSGRKRSDQKKVRISTSLSIDVVDYLKSRQDKPKAQIIEDAIREYKKINDILK